MKLASSWVIGATAGMLCQAPLPALAFDSPFDGGYNQQYQPYQQNPRYPQPARSEQQYYRQQYNSYDQQQYNSYGQQRYSYAAPQSGFDQQYGFPRQGYGTNHENPSDGLNYPSSNGYPRAADPGDGSGDGVRQRRRHRRVTRDEEDGPRRPHRVRTVIGEGSFGTALMGQSVACVRTCDGYFFPMGQAGDTSALNVQASLCTALCPTAKTELFLIPPGADGIETATSLDGTPYSKMPGALKYTKSLTPACTCHASTDSQARLVSLMKDFTLRRGDAVMTTKGMMVFKGTWRWPYKLADFQLLDKAKSYLSNAVALAALEKAAKWLQTRSTVSASAGHTTEAASTTYITDETGKKVRLIGDTQSYAPTEPDERLPPSVISDAASSGTPSRSAAAPAPAATIKPVNARK